MAKEALEMQACGKLRRGQRALRRIRHTMPNAEMGACHISDRQRWRVGRATKPLNMQNKC